MAFLSKLFNLAVTDEKAWNPSLWNFKGAQSPSGENVTEESALTYSAVWCAVNLYCSTISTLPLHLTQNANKKTVKAENHSLYDVLYADANPYMSAQLFREVSLAHILLWGNSYSEIVRDGMGNIVELWPISPNRVRPWIEDGKPVYYITVGADTVKLGRDKILHIPGLGFDGFVGYSVVAMARKSIGLGMAMETFGALFFGQGTHLGVVASHPGKVGQATYDQLKSSLTETISGLGKSHRLLLLEEGMKVEKLGTNPNDSQFLESRQFQIPEVARWFNLPPHKLKDLTKSSFNNIDSEQISFVTDSILPVAIRLEQCYNKQLLTKDERKRQKFYFRHNLEGLLRGNPKDRAEYYKVMLGYGIMTQNEVRAKENLDPSSEKFADELFVQLNTIPLSMLEEHLQKINSTAKVDNIPAQNTLTAP